MSELNDQEIKRILENYRLGTATDEEKALLESWYLTYTEEGTDDPELAERFAAVDNVWMKLENEYRPVKKMWKWTSFAAAALIVLVAGSYFLWRPQPVSVSELAKTSKDIAPGYNKATLTIDGVGILSLDSSSAGIVVKSTSVIYDNNRTVKGTDALIKNPGMLTLTTPKGGTYKLALPDGSVVWLNAASKLVFSSVFHKQKQRVVELEGEGYFEVAKNKQQPFIVKSKGQQVEVLGTHFNINSYSDEPLTKTTLLEGSIRISNKILKPGEQAQNTGKSLVVHEVDTAGVVGWKNNYIVFEDESIQGVMRKISRWYDVDITYEGELPVDDFGGRINRQAYVSQVLRKLELTNKVHFKVAGRRIIVTK
ncbi:FecR family protein [Desertivirga xinjiangensis]|uniref:FecR family protein n=1 Tax=Desertivirga xinjiangensis TaxID=539206 RepID=UPI00210CD983|nr:FecR family protein [Pedobacter xinjiangensis]